MFSLKALICGILLVILVEAAGAAMVFQDEFDLDPAANGWTESADGGDITSDGDNTLFSGPGNTTQAITRTISTAGRTDLFAGFDVAANANSEFNDTFTFLVDSDNDMSFESVVSSSAEGANLANLDFTALPGAAEDNPNLPIRVTWNHNFNDEVMLLDRLVIVDAPLVLATDPFDADPAANGWTESGEVTSNGSGQASLEGDLNSSITKTFDLSGFESILVNLEGLNDGFNDNADSVILEVDAGSGFVEVGRQRGTDSPYLLGALLPPEAENNPSVALRLTADSTFGGQDTLFDALTVRGAIVPEPSALMLLGLAAVLWLGCGARRGGKS